MWAAPGLRYAWVPEAAGAVVRARSFEDGRPAVSASTFVNGFHQTWPIVHAENGCRGSVLAW